MSVNQPENRQNQKLSKKENIIQFVKFGLFAGFWVYRGSMNTREDAKSQSIEGNET